MRQKKSLGKVLMRLKWKSVWMATLIESGWRATAGQAPAMQVPCIL